MTRPSLGDLALVAAGAAAGALARWVIVQVEHAGPVPWVTLAVNVVGAFLLGALPAVPGARGSRPARLLLGPGVLGGFTTVSAWAGQVTAMARDGEETRAGLLLVVTVAAALLAARLGRHAAGPDAAMDTPP